MPVPKKICQLKIQVVEHSVGWQIYSSQYEDFLIGEKW